MTPLAALLAEVRALAEAANLGPLRAMRAGNQYLDTHYMPAARLVGASVVEGLPRPWNPHAYVAFGHRAEQQEQTRLTDEAAAFIVALVNLLPRLLAFAEGEPGAGCRVEATLPTITEDHKALCGQGAYYTRLFGEHKPSYHDLSHLYADLAAESARLKIAPPPAEQDRARAVVDAFWPPHIQAGRPDAVRELTALIAAALAQARIKSWDQIGADRLADEVAVLVRRGVLDARSPAADALLDYRAPPSTPRADRLAELETLLAQARGAGESRDATS